MTSASLGLAVACGAMLAVLAGPAQATIVDPAGDFLDTFTGPHGADLDVVSADATFDGRTFTLSSRQNGAIGGTPGALYVWGIDRGTNAAGFGTFRPGVLFDAVVVANPGGPSNVIVSGTATPLPAGAVVVAGNTISVNVPAALLPSAGFQARDYLVNLWPRTGLGSNSQIADFAPDNADFPVRFLIEPSTALLCAVGFGALAWTRRRRVALG